MNLRCIICGIPWATIQDGMLIVKARHRGRTHTNRIAIAELVELAKAIEKTTERVKV